MPNDTNSSELKPILSGANRDRVHNHLYSILNRRLCKHKHSI